MLTPARRALARPRARFTGVRARYVVPAGGASALRGFADKGDRFNRKASRLVASKKGELTQAVRLEPRRGEIKRLAFAHTGPLEGFEPLEAFAKLYFATVGSGRFALPRGLNVVSFAACSVDSDPQLHLKSRKVGEKLRWQRPLRRVRLRTGLDPEVGDALVRGLPALQRVPRERANEGDELGHLVDEGRGGTVVQLEDQEPTHGVVAQDEHAIAQRREERPALERSEDVEVHIEEVCGGVGVVHVVVT